MHRQHFPSIQYRAAKRIIQEWQQIILGDVGNKIITFVVVAVVVLVAVVVDDDDHDGKVHVVAACCQTLC